MNEEIWKDISGYEEKYQVSSQGRVRSYKKFSNSYKILKPYYVNGYPKIILSLNNTVKKYRIHRLIAEAFIPNPHNKPCVNHINGIKDDNRMENLEWVTYSENMKHAFKTGLFIPKTGIENKKSKRLLVFKDGNHIATLYGLKEQKEFGLNACNIYQCLKGIIKQHKGYTFKR